MQVDEKRLWARLMAMAEVGATAAGGSNRQALSDDDRAGRELFTRWATDAGLTVELDAVGNLFARRAGADPDAPPVVMGSHLDTQPTGGRFDGVYGVLGALEVVETLNDEAVTTRAPIEVAVWTNEEGSRFPMSMMGSAVWAGAYELSQVRELADIDGITVGDELDRLGWVGERRFASPLDSYLELHIEQGPTLEASGSEVGIVTGVQGIRWYTITLDGFPAHAGTTPMDIRRDPARPLAEILTGLYEIANANAPGVRITPAQFRAEPISPNTVPARIRFSIDLRHPDVEALDGIDAELRALIADATAAHGCDASIRIDNDSPPVVFDDRCVAAVTDAASTAGHTHERIVSGAGHDACYVATKAPTSMIFIPCLDGLSHNEAESIDPGQAAAGAQVLLGAALTLAGQS